MQIIPLLFGCLRNLMIEASGRPRRDGGISVEQRQGLNLVVKRVSPALTTIVVGMDFLSRNQGQQYAMPTVVSFASARPNADPPGAFHAIVALLCLVGCAASILLAAALPVEASAVSILGLM